MDVSLAPLLSEPWTTRWHAYGAIAAILLGGLQFALPKGTLGHRTLGYTWVGLLLWTAVSGFWIHNLKIVGPWSPIHLLSIVVLVSAPLAVWQARCGRVERHRRWMLWLYVLALIVTGLFTLWPGRVMHDVLFRAS